MTTFVLRPENPEDVAAIARVNRLAFGRDNEAQLVDTLRQQEAITLSWVAERDGEIVGHVLFSPVTVAQDDGAWTAVALGPMAVLPAYQREGVGSALIRAALSELQKAGHDVVFVLGHAEYYPRFGFVPSRPLGIRWEVDVPEEVFMVAELRAGALNGRTGVVRYHPAFNSV